MTAGLGSSSAPFSFLMWDPDVADPGHLLVLRPGGQDSLEKATKPVSSQGESLATTQPGAPAQVGETTQLQQGCGPPAGQLAAHHALQPRGLTQAHPPALLMLQDLGPPPGLSPVPSSGPCCPIGKQESEAGRLGWERSEEMMGVCRLPLQPDHRIATHGQGLRAGIDRPSPPSPETPWPQSRREGDQLRVLCVQVGPHSLGGAHPTWSG